MYNLNSSYSTIVVYEMFTMSAFLTASAIGFEGLENVENSDGKNDVKIEGFNWFYIAKNSRACTNIRNGRL